MSVATDAGPEQRRALPLLRTLLDVAVVAMFVLLVWNNFTLRRQQQRSAAAAKSVRSFVVRERIGAIPAMTLDGRRSDLDLRESRAVVAVVNPGCDSCRELVASARNAPGVNVLSVASLEETRAHAKDLGPGTRVVARPLPKSYEARLQLYPQVIVIDHGEIVRTCARMEECR